MAGASARIPRSRSGAWLPRRRGETTVRGSCVRAVAPSGYENHLEGFVPADVGRRDHAPDVD
jgi:hypothetical protein